MPLMKEKNKSTIFYITIIIVLFTALLYMTQHKKSSSPVIKIVKEVKTPSTIIEQIVSIVVPSIGIGCLGYIILSLDSINRALKIFRRIITKDKI